MRRHAAAARLLQVSEHSLGPAKRPLGVDHPFVLAQCGEVSFEGGRLGEGGLIGKNSSHPAWYAAVSLSRNRRRKRRESTRTAYSETANPRPDAIGPEDRSAAVTRCRTD